MEWMTVNDAYRKVLEEHKGVGTRTLIEKGKTFYEPALCNKCSMAWPCAAYQLAVWTSQFIIRMTFLPGDKCNKR